MANYSVEYYEREDGLRPAEDFILSLDKKMQAKLFMSLELLELRGPSLREPYIPSRSATEFLRFEQSRELISAGCCISSSLARL